MGTHTLILFESPNPALTFGTHLLLHKSLPKRLPREKYCLTKVEDVVPLNFFIRSLDLIRTTPHFSGMHLNHVGGISRNSHP
jgi:hypothetical protein